MTDRDLAILALVVSVMAALLAWFTAARQNRLQARMLELEEARERDRLAESTRAAVTAMMLRSPHSGRLYVTNEGPAAAHNIRVTLDDKPISTHPYVHDGREVIEVLGAGANVDFIIKTWDGMPTTFHCHVTWENPGGDPGLWESELRFLI